jgi:AmmeMemoRadiSam system protein A
MLSLSEDERSRILELALQSLREAVGEHRLAALIPTDGIFGTPCGVFVSLHVEGKLRGCIGTVESSEPMGKSIVQCAASAALHDPRFAPMRAEEVERADIEVSVLSPLQPIQVQEIVIGKHGLLIQHGRQRGLLLPQVATEHSLSREKFLEETCKKAGLPRDAWKASETVIYGFTCEIVGNSGVKNA